VGHEEAREVTSYHIWRLSSRYVHVRSSSLSTLTASAMVGRPTGASREKSDGIQGPVEVIPSMETADAGRGVTNRVACGCEDMAHSIVRVAGDRQRSASKLVVSAKRPAVRARHRTLFRVPQRIMILTRIALKRT
jgi:hypothetical protein